MKVILLENVKRIGSIGEVIDVKRGFARNFLIANKKALYASKENIKEVEKIKNDLSKKDLEKKKEAREIKDGIVKSDLIRLFSQNLMVDELDFLKLMGKVRNKKNSKIDDYKPINKLNFENVLRMHNSFNEDKSFSFCELGPRKGKITFSSEEFSKRVGDVVLWRRGYPAYHLACVIDDSEQKITHVVRGLDLFDATKIHTVLNSLLGLKRPFYYHHKLICDDNGKRLAKRADSKSIQNYK